MFHSTVVRRALFLSLYTWRARTELFYLYIMCIFVLIFNNKDKIMTKIFIFPYFGLNIHHTYLYFVT